MDKVCSSDDTTIAFDRLGVGSSVILTSGASVVKDTAERVVVCACRILKRLER